MNQRLDLRGLRDGMDLPATDVAAGAWDRGRRRVRRRRAAGAVAVVAVVAAVILVPGLVGDRAQRGVAPAGPDRPTETVPAGPEAYAAVADDQLATDVDRLRDEMPVIPRGDPVDLDADPVPYAVLAVEARRDVLVLGPDSRYRRVDGVGPRPGLSERSLSPDADHLVLAGPDAVTSIDLTTGGRVRAALAPGGGVDEAVQLVGWVDDTTVVVSNGDRGSALVDVVTGEVGGSDLGDLTALGPDGPVRWEGGRLRAEGLSTTTAPSVNIGGSVLAGDGFAVAGTGAAADSVGLEDQVDEQVPFVDGPLVVDLESGRPLAYLPIPASTTRLPQLTAPFPVALEDDAVLLNVTLDDRPAVVRWDWRAGEVTGVVRLGGPRTSAYVSWGRGLDAMMTS